MNAGKLSWRTAWRIAWRDLRSSRGKFIFIAFAIAVGVGSLAGVRGFGRAFRTMLLAEARTLMAADLMVRVFEVPSADQQRLFDSLELRGARRTGITETVSMITAGDDDPPMFCGIKAVDPYTVQFTLASPDVTFLNKLALNFAFIVPREEVEKSLRGTFL